MARPRQSGLSHEQAKHLSGVLRRFIGQYDNNQRRMAKAWGLSQPQLSCMLRGEQRGAGIASLIKIREHTDLSIDELLGLTPLSQTALDASAGDLPIEVRIEKAVDARLKEILDKTVDEAVARRFAAAAARR